jgi:hypothetical protein
MTTREVAMKHDALALRGARVGREESRAACLAAVIIRRAVLAGGTLGAALSPCLQRHLPSGTQTGPPFSHHIE